MTVKRHIITETYALYCGDSCQIIQEFPDESVGFSIFSPPFCDLYSYSDSIEDMGNNKDYKSFFTHFKFLAEELHRVLIPGRVVAIHCMDMPTFKRSGEEIGLKDFPGEIIRLFQEVGFIYHSRHCIWKDPLIAATRTKAIGLAHKQIVKDSALCRTGIPDYILAFRKKGVNPKPIIHPRGLTTYYGERSIPHHLDYYFPDRDDDYIDKSPYDPAHDKRSHWIWQQYASPCWFDIRQTKVLQYKKAREADDEKHVCPLQTDIIERCMELWSTKADVVFTPFLGVGSEVYVAVKNGRKGVGCELKLSYYKQAIRNVRMVCQKSIQEIQR